jgi:predicted secreted acid phosphatase
MQAIQNLYRVLLAATLLLTTITSHAEPPNLDLVRQKAIHYHDSGAYAQDLQKVAKQAMQYIDKRSSENNTRKHPQKLAIVLDIDETSLSNYPKMRARQFVATKTQLVNEILAGDAPAIKPVLALYRNAIKHHIAVFFVTGRHEPERQATIKNLKNVGFKHWDGIYFKPTNYHMKSAIPYKSHTRERITHLGYTIIASIGDQYSDIKGGYTESGFKLPNPYYYLP